MREFLSQEEKDHLAGVIAEIERETDGEIRLMIVKRSASTAHVFFAVWVALIALALMLLWFARYELIFQASWWIVPSIILASFAAALVLSRIDSVRRAFTPLADLKHNVWARAEVEFYREGLNRTVNQTGVLIFLSLMERQAVVLADRGINSKVEKNTWNDVVAAIVLGAKTGQWPKQFELALRECGKHLKQHFPVKSVNRNELPDTVILKE